MSDTGAVAMSRKQRLMAALEEDERATTPGTEEQPGVLVYCFICGGGVPRGREVRLPVRCPAREGCAFFPFLQQQEPAPGAEPLSPGGCVRVCAVCQRFLAAQWDAFERSRTPLEKRMYWLKRPYQCGGDGARSNPRDWNPNYDSDLSDLSDNDLSEPEESGEARPEPTQGNRRPWAVATVPSLAPPHCAPCRGSPNDRARRMGAEIEQSHGRENGHLSGMCYICGGHSAGHTIHVQKQEHTPQTPFFPFLWLHTPPAGAQPITPGGSARACSRCFSSLMQQWQSFDMANVPVLQRLYVVPLHANSTPEKAAPQRAAESHPSAPALCYLCGEDCANHVKLVQSRITNGNAKTSMHFPFLSQLPCPPSARGVNQQGEAQSCRKCYGVLEDIWSIYRASQNEELINSAQSFLARYHQVFNSLDPGTSAESHNSRPEAISGHISICYVCGAEPGPGLEYQVSINPPSRYGDKEPFFPFLTVYPPAPRAKPADSTGLVSTCGLCYHDLLGQWFQQEMKSQQPSSPWSRQYQVETFVCFFCRQEKKRMLGLKAIQVARLPVFLHAPRMANTLLVDDGKQLLIGACIECRPLALAGISTTQSGAMVPSQKIEWLPSWLYSSLFI
ncbi:hypothetical protein XELAEV_18022685mg [Xenopus laevis]|uniref:Genetic suppressor element 1 n=1 Tax=Xenopus laevis TaxID=8355 RepID=A0A974D3P5_XENLA|nr:hypothetical protein XELAEV_18022685mg [Xenopus laevis]